MVIILQSLFALALLAIGVINMFIGSHFEGLVLIALSNIIIFNLKTS